MLEKSSDQPEETSMTKATNRLYKNTDKHTSRRYVRLNLIMCRKRLGYSIRDLAVRLNMLPSTLKNIENGVYLPSQDVIDRIAKELLVLDKDLMMELIDTYDDAPP